MKHHYQLYIQTTSLVQEAARAFDFFGALLPSPPPLQVGSTTTDAQALAGDWRSITKDLNHVWGRETRRQ